MEKEMSMETLLKEWGFEELIELFKDNGIDDEAFVLLEDDNLKELIPNMGKRLKFKKKIQEYLSRENLQCYHDVDGENSTSNTSSTITILETVGFPIENNAVSDNFVVPELPNKRQKLETLFDKGLLQYLETFPDGRVILRNKNKMNEYFRAKLCKIIIDYLFSKHSNYKIPQIEFEKAASEIENCFPEESSNIYFRPYQPKTNISPRHQCGGKLWAKYTNLKKVYNYLDKSKTVFDDSSENQEINNIQEDISLQYINNNCSPFEEVTLHWKLSFNSRRKLLKQSDVHNYITNFPALKLPEGYTLLLEDFERMYSDKKNNFFSKWPELRMGILNLGLGKGLLQEGSSFNDVVALLTLPLLFSPTTVREGKKTWRPSKMEVSRSFIIHINNTSELHSTIEQNRQDAAKKKISLQPFSILAGDKKNPEGIVCYVSINDNLYFIENCLKALDVTFKIFFALEAKYPAESNHIWTYIQRYIYNIDTPHDIRSNSVEVFASEIKSQSVV